MPSRPCAGPSPRQPCPTGQLVKVHRHNSKQAVRCARCRAQHQRAHNQRRPDLHNQAERRRRAQAVADHVAAYGWRCPGWPGHHGPHPSRDLTAHHVDAVAGGGNPHGRLAVICRSLNAKLGARR